MSTGVLLLGTYLFSDIQPSHGAFPAHSQEGLAYKRLCTRATVLLVTFIGRSFSDQVPTGP